MAHYATDAEPFEESQGNRGSKASPDELKAFYDMERQSDIQRKLSKRKTSSTLWSRKSLRRTSSSQPPQPAPAPSLKSPSATTLAGARAPSVDDLGGGERSDSVPPMPLSRSIIPDLLKELPAWYNPPRADAGYIKNRHLHNPVGPRFYFNHHLFAPGNTRPATRPPSVFSPSFPPMASGSLDGLSISNSPLPTPNSSQTHMADGGNVPRSRKNSQTAHDNVDLLDVSDPWGNPWHHQSPYDVGKSSSPVSFEENPQQPARPRTVSTATAQNRRKTVTPSPLSQSTSAVHLQVSTGRPPTRKLSKRRTLGIFGRHAMPASPMEEPESQKESPQGPSSSFVVTNQKERRGSVLGRIAKRFSISRKPPAAGMEVVRQPSPVKRQPSPEKPVSSEPIKRVPPPLIQADSSFVIIPPVAEPSKNQVDRTSSDSFEGDVGYTMGRLTVANPDPGSVESTPVQREVSLPAEEAQERSHEREATDGTSSVPLPESHTISQLPEPMPHSPETVASPPISLSSSQPSTEIVSPSPPPPTSPVPMSPPPPPAPEKPTNFPNYHSSSNPHLERSISPPSEKMPGPSALTSRPRMQSPVDKPQPPSPQLPAIPFPAGYGPPTPLPKDVPPELPEMTADISPYSVSSMLANPPTPYAKDAPIPDDMESLPPPVPSKRSSRDPSPSQVAVTARETETFRLIRSASGTVYASSETIRAGTEQWEVVESPTSRSKTKSQDRESGSRREQRRQAKADKEAESDQPKVRSERSRKRRSAEATASTSQSFPRVESVERHQRAPIPEALVSREEEARVGRFLREEDRDRRSERKNVDPRLNKPQPAPPGRRLESKSVRPISEVPPAADMNAMKAREAWDMERLWKARSMSGMEPNGTVVAAPEPILNGKQVADPSAVYGSSRTAFLVSTPFQPPGPSPAMYPAGYAQHSSDTNRESTHVFPTRSSNPLPEPPRESPYQPAPISLSEYWSKHSVTTAH